MVAWIVCLVAGASTTVIWAVTVVGCVLWGAVLYERRSGGSPPDVPS